MIFNSLTRNFKEGEAFVLLDAGGGTVDATTYTVDKSSPLRLSKELVPSDGMSASPGDVLFLQKLTTILQDAYMDQVILMKVTETIYLNALHPKRIILKEMATQSKAWLMLPHSHLRTKVKGHWISPILGCP